MRAMNGLRSSQSGRTGMKSTGLASSTLISRLSLRAGMALSSDSCSGAKRRSTSIVVGRQPNNTAVAPPVKYTRPSARAASARPFMNR